MTSTDVATLHNSVLIKQAIHFHFTNQSHGLQWRDNVLSWQLKE